MTGQTTPANGAEVAVTLRSVVGVRVDRDSCTGIGTCVADAPGIFVIEETGGVAFVVDPDDGLLEDPDEIAAVGPDRAEEVVEAALNCGQECIKLYDHQGLMLELSIFD